MAILFDTELVGQADLWEHVIRDALFLLGQASLLMTDLATRTGIGQNYTKQTSLYVLAFLGSTGSSS